MKMVSLFATAAAVALIAGSASAQAVTETSYVNPANAGNSGTVAEELTATFSISGSVSPSCILGNGDGDLDDVNFGTLGIYGDAANGVDNAFEMVGANSNGNSSTNAAGCNTSNRLTLTKTNGTQGLLNADAAAAGWDPNVFQANIPYSLGAVYTAGSPGQEGVSASGGKFTVSTTEASDSRENNAWRSGLGIRVDIPAAAKALVAGTYTDTVTVLIEVI
ncbi:hypothetical protein D3C80_764500 [compost metagenome]|jgi:hypothetical protein